MGESHYNFGLYFKTLNKKDTALFHFKKALDYFPPGSGRADAVNQAISSLKNKTTPDKNLPARPQRFKFNVK
jgi:beta-barrel assembly-enhancing protease